MSELRDLYQEVILDHNRAPRNFGALPNANRESEGHNPLCGDRVKISLHVEGDRIEDIRFQGSGCAISTASASLMTEALKGRTVEEARRLFHGFHGLLTVGRSVAEAFVGMYFFEASCMMQVRAQAGGGPLRHIPQAIVDDAPRQFATVTRGAGGNLAWPALRRRLDRSDPGYQR